MLININKLNHGPYRIIIHEDRVDETRLFTESVERYGILTPLIVRHLEDDKYEIIDGMMRYLAAKELGLEYIDCHLVDCRSNEDYLTMQYVCNMHRLLPTQTELRVCLRRIMYKDQVTVTELAKKLCKPEQEIIMVLQP